MKSRNVTKGKMIASIIGICLAALLIIFAFCGRYAENGFRDFGNFFLGTFGMAFYGLMAAVIVACSFTLAGKTIKLSAKYTVFFVLTFVSVVLFVHTLTTTYLIDKPFSDPKNMGYVQLVYNYYDNVIGVPTFGGVVFGCICWALTKALTVWGAMIVIVLLLGVSVYFVGEFFYAYFTGKLTLQSERKQNDIEPSVETASVSPLAANDTDQRQQMAYKVLFENQTYPEEVSSTPAEKYDISPQSTLDNPATEQRNNAASILFGQDAPSNQTQQGGNSFFRPTTEQQAPEQGDDFIVRGYYNPTENVQPKPQEEAASAWKVTTPVTEQRYDPAPVAQQPERPVQPEQNVETEFAPVIESFDEPDITDVVVDEPQPEPFVEEKFTEEEKTEVEADADGETTEAEPEQQESDDELVAIPGETPIDTPMGTAIQTKLDIISRGELKKEQERVHKYPKYNQPPVDLLNDITIVEDTEADFRAKAAEAITNKLAVFKIRVEIADTIVGPSVTRYMFNVLSPTTRMSEFAKYSDDIKACVEAQDDIRIEAPVHGTKQVGIEVANKVKRPVVLRSILESENFKKAKGNLVFAIGQEITGKAVVADLADMPHLLIAGATGSGKSVALNCLIVSLMYKYGPEYLRFVMVDPKFVELSRYNGIPHMLTSETITTTNDALAGMDYLINEMESRYQLFRQNAVGNIGEYNSRINPRITQRLPYLVFIVDELADLMAASKQSFESKLQRLAQKSRAAGIHIVLATQRPDVKTITGTIKANLPCRMALKVSSPPDSTTIINCGGAEKLLGKGDMLFMSPGSPDLLRVQGAYISNDEIRGLVEYARETNEVYYDEKISEEIFVSQKQAAEEALEQEQNKEDSKETQVDPLCKKALRFWLERNSGKASIASIQRNLGIGFNRAGRIMDTLQRLGYVETLSPSEPSSKPLKVLVSIEELDGIFPELAD